MTFVEPVAWRLASWSWPASPPALRRLNRAMQAAIVDILLAGRWLPNASVVINALLALGVTLLPAALRRDPRLTLSPSLTVWPTLAVMLHAVGMLGPCGAVWW